MRVRELLETNDHVTDLEVKVRWNGFLRDALYAGLSSGIKPVYPIQIPVDPYKYSPADKTREADYLPKPINAWDKDGYFKVLISKIPAKYLDLEVDFWKADTPLATHHPRLLRGSTFAWELQRLKVTALAPDSYRPAPEKPEPEEAAEIDQVTIADLLGGGGNV